MGKQKISSSLALSENGFLFLPTTGETFTVNEMGKLILKYLQDGKDQQSIVNAIAEEYDVEAEDIQRDYLDFMGQLKQFQLVVEG
jgi:hypothetical protein